MALLGRAAIQRLASNATTTSKALHGSRLTCISLRARSPSSSLSCRSPSRFLCYAASDSDASRTPARLAQARKLLEEAELRSSGPILEVPKVSLDHVTVTFARSGGPGGQNVNKVNTKVDMRFNMKEADWLPEKIREKLLQSEKNRINSQGELVISSTKTRTQKGNIEDALSKLQALIDAAAYVPPPPSEETKKKITRMAKISNEKRLESKKKSSQKKASRRGGWD